MRQRLSRAPWWVLSLVTGLLFAVFMSVATAAMRPDSSRVAAIVGAVVGGALFGVAMGPWLVRQRDSARAAIGEFASDREREVIRAANRGPLPTDPQVREAAARLVRYRLDVMARQRRWAAPFFAVMTLVGASYALLRSPVWWAAAALFGAFLVAMFVQPGHMARRLRELEGSRRRI